MMESAVCGAACCRRTQGVIWGQVRSEKNYLAGLTRRFSRAARLKFQRARVTLMASRQQYLKLSSLTRKRPRQYFSISVFVP